MLTALLCTSNGGVIILCKEFTAVEFVQVVVIHFKTIMVYKVSSKVKNIHITRGTQ